MRDYITNDNLAKISANYKNQNKGWVKSYFDVNSLIDETMDKFAVLIPDFDTHNISLQGSMTWGQSGFSFELKSTVKTDKTPITIFQVHNDNCKLSEENIYYVIGILLRSANEKVTTESIVDYRGYSFKSPTLKALKRTAGVTDKNQKSIKKHTDIGKFDPVFAQFLISNEDKGIRCHGQ